MTRQSASAAPVGGKAPSGPARSRKTGSLAGLGVASKQREQIQMQVRTMQGLVDQCRVAVARAQALSEEQDPVPSAKHASKGSRVDKVDIASLKRKLETAFAKNENDLAALVELHANKLKEAMKRI